jgi:hypothetical protein
MSALPPKADMCTAMSNVRYGPKADITIEYRGSSASAKVRNEPDDYHDVHERQDVLQGA